MNKIVNLQSRSLPSLPITSENIPPAIKEGIQELYAAFADAGRKEDIDKAFTMKGYIRAIVGQHPVIVLWAVQHLVLHNPRNPFRPTAQDVHELIEKKWSELRREVCSYYLGCLSSFAGYKITNPKPYKRHPLSMPDMDELGDLSSEVSRILRAEIPEVNFAAFSQADLDDIPSDAWPSGEYARACEEVRRAKQEALAREAKEQAEEQRRLEKYGRPA